jgi:hypothetical protein
MAYDPELRMSVSAVAWSRIRGGVKRHVPSRIPMHIPGKSVISADARNPSSSRPARDVIDRVVLNKIRNIL